MAYGPRVPKKSDALHYGDMNLTEPSIMGTVFDGSYRAIKEWPTATLNYTPSYSLI